ncbi:hypothetical protein [Longimicrobium sp.]|uniref:hypothetical protein n=1 Tax=Longimicrobium sp. TaxID=2029185 RepID=UPI002F929DFE
MRKVAMLVALAVFLAGCGDGGTGPGDGLTGRYTLKTAAGISIPGVYGDNGVYRWEILAGRVRINRDSSFTFVLDNRETAGSIVELSQLEEKGVVRATGANLEFRAADDGRLRMRGSISGDTLTVMYSAAPFVFLRD